MADAPERIWAWDDKTPTDRDKGWSACDAGTGSTEYIRADLVEAMEAENQRLREALTPSGDTKAAYMGEFYMGITLQAGGDEDYRRVQIPWTTIKEIMAKIRARAALRNTGEGGEKSGSSKSSKWGPDFPPSDCTAWEDCHHDGVCHDADCSARLRTEASHDD